MLQELIFGSVGLVGGAAGAGAATWSIAKSKIGKETDARKTVLNLAAHSLRSYLNNVLGQSQLLSSRAKHYRSEDRHLIEGLLGSSGDVNRVLLDVLELVDLDMKNIALDRRETLLWDLFRDIEISAIRNARKVGRNIEIDFCDSLCSYYNVDPDRINQCVTAIIGQCLSQAAGDVRLHAAIKNDEKNGHRLVVTATDPSAKMQQYQANAYFDPKTFRLSHHLGTTNAWRLSVLLARKVAKLAGGDLAADADLEKGLAFKYTLPIKFIRRAEKEEYALADAATDTMEAFVPKTTAAQHDPETTRLLIVDDDQTNLMILEALLNSIGYTNVVTAEDGKMALDLFREGDFDAIVTDIQMPNMSGLELARAVRQLPGTESSVPMIAASAAATTKDRHASFEAGISAFIAKPIIQDELCVVLKEQLDLATTELADVSAA